MDPLELLQDRSCVADARMPDSLARLYGGPLRIADGTLYVNFVVSLDGVVAVGPEGSPLDVGGGSESDRFVMGLLRARADAVLIGAGTFRSDPAHHWTAEFAYPPATADFATYRSRLGLPPRPTLVVVTSSGEIDGDHPALRDGACVMTTSRAAPGVRAKVPEAVTVRALGPSISFVDVVAAMRAEGLSTILCEGGPRVLGELLAAQLVDELFLTVSPLLAGRAPGTLALVEGIAPQRGQPVRTALSSVRVDREQSFFRYLVEKKTVH